MQIEMKLFDFIKTRLWIFNWQTNGFIHNVTRERLCQLVHIPETRVISAHLCPFWNSELNIVNQNQYPLTQEKLTPAIIKKRTMQ